MMMLTKKELISIAVISIAIAVIGFVLDVNERVPNILTNIMETLILSCLVFAVVTMVYIPIKLIVFKLRKQKA